MRQERTSVSLLPERIKHKMLLLRKKWEILPIFGPFAPQKAFDEKMCAPFCFQSPKRKPLPFLIPGSFFSLATNRPFAVE